MTDEQKLREMAAKNECDSALATRPLLYTDTISGEQICRDNMWAVTTAELNAMQRRTDRMEEILEMIELLPRCRGNVWLLDESDMKQIRAALAKAVAADLCAGER